MPIVRKTPGPAPIKRPALSPEDVKKESLWDPTGVNPSSVGYYYGRTVPEKAKLSAQLAEYGKSVGSHAVYTLWNFLDLFDRPMYAALNLRHSLAEHKTSWRDAWGHVAAGFTGKERTDWKHLLEKHATPTGQGISSWPAYVFNHVLLGHHNSTWDDAARQWGSVWNVFVNPVNVASASMVGKVAKGLKTAETALEAAKAAAPAVTSPAGKRVISQAGKAALRGPVSQVMLRRATLASLDPVGYFAGGAIRNAGSFIGSNRFLSNVVKPFRRGIGYKELDLADAKAIQDRLGVVRDLDVLLGKISTPASRIPRGPLRKIVMPLAEENSDIELLVDMARAVKNKDRAKFLSLYRSLPEAIRGTTEKRIHDLLGRDMAIEVEAAMGKRSFLRSQFAYTPGALLSPRNISKVLGREVTLKKVDQVPLFRNRKAVKALISWASHTDDKNADEVLDAIRDTVRGVHGFADAVHAQALVRGMSRNDLLDALVTKGNALNAAFRRSYASATSILASHENTYRNNVMSWYGEQLKGANSATKAEAEQVLRSLLHGARRGINDEENFKRVLGERFVDELQRLGMRPDYVFSSMSDVRHNLSMMDAVHKALATAPLLGGYKRTLHNTPLVRGKLGDLYKMMAQGEKLPAGTLGLDPEQLYTLEKNLKEMIDAEREVKEVIIAAAKTPVYVHRVVSRDAMIAMNRAKGTEFERYMRAMADPTVSLDMERKFRINERPLSLEEVKESINRLEYRTGKVGPNPTSVEAEAVAEPIYVIYKQDMSEWVKNRARALFGFSHQRVGSTVRDIYNPTRLSKVIGEDYVEKKLGKALQQEVADFYDMDLGTMLVDLGQKQGKSIRGATFINEALQRVSPKGAVHWSDVTSRMRTEGWRRIGDDPDLMKIIAEQGGGMRGGLMPQIENYAMPEVYFHEFKKMVSMAGQQKVSGALGQAWDKVMGYYVSQQLLPFFGFHARNHLGYLTGMHIGGWMADPKYAARDLVTYFKVSRALLRAQFGHPEDMARFKFHNAATNSEHTLEEALDWATRSGASKGSPFSETFLGESEKIFEKGTWYDPLKQATTYIPFTNSFITMRAGKNIGRLLDETHRLTNFISRLERGDAIDAAAMHTKKYLGDVSGEMLTPFEKKVMVRIMPYYRWFRYNVPFQAEQLIYNPVYRAKLITLKRVLDNRARGVTGYGVTDLPSDAVPEYIQAAAGVPLSRDKKTGDLQYGIAEGWLTPFDLDIILAAFSADERGAGDVASKLISQINPMGRVFVETALGSTAMGGGLPTEGRKTVFMGRVWPASFVALIRNWRFLNELNNLDPFNAFTHGPGPVDPFFRQKPLKQRILRTFTGLSFFGANPFKVRSRNDMRRVEEMRSWLWLLRSRGYMPQPQGDPKKSAKAHEAYIKHYDSMVNKYHGSGKAGR
jgi:hypothetical protein